MITATLATLILLAAPPARCQAPSPEKARPDWLSGSAAEFPKDAYLIGVGSGVSEEKAADKARAELAKFFGIKLVAQSVSAAREVSDGKDSSFSQEVSDDVRTFTSQVLEGVEVPRFWQEPSGAVYALAVLNREAALRTMTGKLEDLDAEFRRNAELLAKTEGKFARLRYALDLVKLAQSRKELNKQYRLLSPSGKSLPGPDTGDLVAEAKKAVKAISFQVEASGDSAGAVGSRLIDAMSSHGLRTSESGGKRRPDVLVEAYAEAQALPPENLLWFWAKGSIVVRLSYGSSGEVFSRFEESAQEAAREPGSSVDVALRKLASRAAERVYQVVTTQELSDE